MYFCKQCGNSIKNNGLAIVTWRTWTGEKNDVPFEPVVVHKGACDRNWDYSWEADDFARQFPNSDKELSRTCCEYHSRPNTREEALEGIMDMIGLKIVDVRATGEMARKRDEHNTKLTETWTAIGDAHGITEDEWLFKLRT